MPQATKKKKTNFKISTTAMSRFWTCPYSYLLGKTMKPKVLPKWMETGTRCHQALAGEDVDLSPQERDMVESILDTLKEDQYDISDTEVRQYFPITKDIDGVRVIDAIATQNGKPVLIDYKFATKPSSWQHTYGISPKSRGFQAYMYLIPPFNHKGEWPKEIHFIVQPGIVYVTLAESEKIKELQESAELILYAERNNLFPRDEGWKCNGCLYFHACHELRGWEDRYHIKEDEE